jgi:hypothetical protein
MNLCGFCATCAALAQDSAILKVSPQKSGDPVDQNFIALGG